MQESYRKDPASHPDPESCVGGREAAGEALTGAHAGQPSSCGIRSSGVPTPLCEAEGHTEGGVTIPKQGKWLRSVVQGYFNDHGVPGNKAALEAFRTETVRGWLRALRRRSQRHRMKWERFRRH